MTQGGGFCLRPFSFQNFIPVIPNFFRSLWLVLSLGIAAISHAPAPYSLSGSWRIDLTQSTELSLWKGYDLTIAIDGDQVTLHRELASGRRKFSDTTPIDTTRDVNVIPVEMRPDNRHVGAYVGGDKTKRVRAVHGRFALLIAFNDHFDGWIQMIIQQLASSAELQSTVMRTNEPSVGMRISQRQYAAADVGQLAVPAQRPRLRF